MKPKKMTRSQVIRQRRKTYRRWLDEAIAICFGEDDTRDWEGMKIQAVFTQIATEEQEKDLECKFSHKAMHLRIMAAGALATIERNIKYGATAEEAFKEAGLGVLACVRAAARIGVYIHDYVGETMENVQMMYFQNQKRSQKCL